jgi:hypothetical protein
MTLTDLFFTNRGEKGMSLVTHGLWLLILVLPVTLLINLILSAAAKILKWLFE